MYLRAAFAETDLPRILALIRANHFGLLATHEPDGLSASHLPFTAAIEDGTLVLEAHFGAANAQCAAIVAGREALAVFSGPHAYISPSWYETQPSVPTWDFAAVHVHGVLEAVEDDAAVASGLDALSADDPGGFAVAGLADGYRRAMFKGIRAFRLRATRVEAQWKMSQNRSVADRRGVVAGLRARGEDAVAALVEATIPVP